MVQTDRFPIRDQKGFTIIEVLIAMAIFAIGVLGVAALQLTSARTNTSAGNITANTFVGEDRVEMGRDEKGPTQGFARQLGDHLFGLEGRQDLAIAAEIDRRGGENETSTVEQGRRSQVAIVGTITAIFRRHAIEG